MTLEAWKSDEALTKWASTVFHSPNGKTFLAMLHDAHAKNTQRLDLGNACQNSADLGRIFGYDQCLNNIESASRIQKPKQALQETWGVPEPEPNKK